MNILKNKNQLIVLVSLILVGGFLTTGLLSYLISLSILREQITSEALPLTSDNVYSEIQRDILKPVFISSFMAQDAFLRDWVLNGEQEVAQITRYLKEIKQRYNTITSFFVSEKTRIYYHADGILKKVDPREERDIWYFRVRKMQTDYEINVDPDLANRDTMTIFINYRVYDYAGTYIGVTGVGLSVSSLISLMEDYDQRYRRNIYFIDAQGNIVLHGYTFPDTAANIYDIEGISSLAAEILSDTKHSFEYSRNSRTVYLNSRFVPELNWYLLVEQTEDRAGGQILNALLINMAICAFITAVIVTITVLSINIYQKITQKQQDELQKKNKALEKALLMVKQLSGLLPICSKCKRIRDDSGNWEQVEYYIKDHSEADFSHGLCPDCARDIYGEYYEDEGEKRGDEK